MTKNRTPTPVYLDPGMHPGLEVKALKFVNINKKTKGFFQFEIIINVSVSSSRFIRIPIVWVYGRYEYFTFSVQASTLDVII